MGPAAGEEEQEEAWDREVAAECRHWVPVASAPFLLVGHALGARSVFPPEVQRLVQPSNCNVGITLFQGRLFVGWRTAQRHFAGREVRMVLASAPFDRAAASPAEGCAGPWELEHVLELGTDLREPHFYAVGDRLFFSFFRAGAVAVAFTPQRMCWTERRGPGDWTAFSEWGEPGEVAWQYARAPAGGPWYMCTNRGSHLALGGRPSMRVDLYSSEDGVVWSPASRGSAAAEAQAPSAAAAAALPAAAPPQPVYPPPHFSGGGVSEAAIAFDLEGGLWAVGRNEDGDDSGFGSRVFCAPPGAPAQWVPTQAESDPRIFQSPRLFRFGAGLYLVSRHDPDGPYWFGSWSRACGFLVEQNVYRVANSFRRHETALSVIDRAGGSAVVRPLCQLPGWGDTGFPSVVRLSKTRFLVANYSSPLEERCAKWGWLRGQVSTEGTQVHLLFLDFVPAAEGSRQGG